MGPCSVGPSSEPKTAGKASHIHSAKQVGAPRLNRSLWQMTHTHTSTHVFRQAMSCCHIKSSASSCQQAEQIRATAGALIVAVDSGDVAAAFYLQTPALVVSSPEELIHHPSLRHLFLLLFSTGVAEPRITAAVCECAKNRVR